jgi:hypothetical protein
MQPLLPNAETPFPGRTAARRALAVCGAWVALLSSTTAATYYIDFETGRDTNAGTSRTAPWKHAPGMAPFVGTYKPAPGDQLIFKGGVVWTNQMYIQGRTGTEEAPIVYRSAADWFKGTTYSRPVLDMQARVLEPGLSPHGGHRGNVVWVQSSSYVTIADLEIRNYVWNNPASTSVTDGFAVYYNGGGNNVASNVYVHSWRVRISADGKFGGIGQASSSNNTAIHCRIEGPNILEDPEALVYITDTGCVARGFCTSGSGTYHIANVIGNEISGTTQGIWGGNTVRNNIIGHDTRGTCDSFSKSSHENGTWQQNNSEFSGNIMYNIRAGVGAYFLPGWGKRGNMTQRVFNNIFYNTPQINLSSQQNPDTSNQLWFFNNVVDRSNNSIAAGTTKSGAAMGTFVIANNLFIAATLDSTMTGRYVASGDSPAKFVRISDQLGANFTNTANLFMSREEAAARGMTFGNLYRPANNNYAPPPPNGIPTARRNGLNLAWLQARWDAPNTDFVGNSRASLGTGGWDIGPYVLEGAAPPARPSVGLFAETESLIAGRSTRLHWYSLNAASVTISGLGNVPPQGSVQIAPATTTTYTATAVGADGSSSTASVKVTVGAVPQDDTGQWLEAEEGIIAEPFVIQNGHVSQPATTSLVNGGFLIFRFQVAEPGEYGILAEVDAPGLSANSFFVSINDEPLDPASIWDIPLTSGFQDRVVSWRGTRGTETVPEHPQAFFDLEAGEHELNIVGREGGVRLRKLMVVKRPAAPLVRQTVRVP